MNLKMIYLLRFRLSLDLCGAGSLFNKSLEVHMKIDIHVWLDIIISNKSDGRIFQNTKQTESVVPFSIGRISG